MIKYFNGGNKKYLTLSADDIKVVKWYADISFAVHPYFKIRTGAIINMGHGTMQSVSKKRKLNTRRSTEDELVAVDNASVYIFFIVIYWVSRVKG